MDHVKEMNAEDLMKTKGEQMRSRMKQEQKNKVKTYQHLNKNAKKNQILFTGSSLMEQFPINEIMMSDGLDRIILTGELEGLRLTIFWKRLILCCLLWNRPGYSSILEPMILTSGRMVRTGEAIC